MTMKPDKKPCHETEPLSSPLVTESKIRFSEVASTASSTAGGALLGVAVAGVPGAAIGGLVGLAAGIVTATSQHDRVITNENEGQ